MSSNFIDSCLLDVTQLRLVLKISFHKLNIGLGPVQKNIKIQLFCVIIKQIYVASLINPLCDVKIKRKVL